MKFYNNFVTLPPPETSGRKLQTEEINTTCLNKTGLSGMPKIGMPGKPVFYFFKIMTIF